MTAKRSDGIEEEPFDLDDDGSQPAPVIVPPGQKRPQAAPARPAQPAPPAQRAAPARPAQPAPAAQRAAPAPPPAHDDYPEDDLPPEDGDGLAEAPGGIAGLPPQTVKLIAGGVVLLAAVGVLAALALRTSSKNREEQARERKLLDTGVALTYQAARFAVAYFSTRERTVPPEFSTYFRENNLVVDVVIQHQPSGSVTFYPVAFALERDIDKLTERAKRNPKPIPGTEVYETRGTAVIGGRPYPIRVFRQNIKDVNGKVLGRVAVMLFEL
jgi:hypothetical protein